MISIKYFRSVPMKKVFSQFLLENSNFRLILVKILSSFSHIDDSLQLPTTHFLIFIYFQHFSQFRMKYA